MLQRELEEASGQRDSLAVELEGRLQERAEMEEHIAALERRVQAKDGEKQALQGQMNMLMVSSSDSENRLRELKAEKEERERQFREWQMKVHSEWEERERQFREWQMKVRSEFSEAEEARVEEQLARLIRTLSLHQSPRPYHHSSISLTAWFPGVACFFTAG